jgi:hypothetical protein
MRLQDDARLPVGQCVHGPSGPQSTWEKQMKSIHQLVLGFVACSLASAALNVAADAAGDWVAYRESVGLPLDPQPSKKGELPTFAGPVADAPLDPVDAARELAIAKENANGNGNGNGGGRLRICDHFFVEMARTDGDTSGESGRCY